ncbi:MAG: hypothetical protein RL398_1315 [Planctomycetota bacterium]
MRDHLPWLLTLLTLLDLAFVQATDIVPVPLMLPLWGLALGAHWLRRLQRLLVYRIVWNVGVLGAFAALVHRATASGLVHMLEDGLLLAALCQVHLLNNVGERQRPDLVFFNSFLIAFVTSLFAPDFGWSLLFGLHAGVFVLGLEMLAVGRSGRELAAPVARALLRDGLVRCAMIAALTAVVFVAWPRDFDRRGWIGDAMNVEAALGGGLADRVSLAEEGATRLDDRVVLKIRPESGEPSDVPSHWRVRTFALFDGEQWLPPQVASLGSRFASDVPWRGTGDGWRRGEPSVGHGLRIDLQRSGDGRLPVPLEGAWMRPDDDAVYLVDPKADATLAFLAVDGGARGGARYEVAVSERPPIGRPAALVRSAFSAPPPSALSGDLDELLRRIGVRDVPEGESLRVARSIERWLAEHRSYALPGAREFAVDFAAFLRGEGSGHCEYFASGLALLLRRIGVPCRLVGGYLAHEWDAAASETVVRGHDAHAWVEVLGEDGAWCTLDATPAAGLESIRSGPAGWWGAVEKSLSDGWREIVRFDGLSAVQWAAAARIGFAAGVIAALALLVLRVIRRRALADEVGAVDRAMRRLGLTCAPTETMRELLVRAERDCAAAPPEQLAALREAVVSHELARYGRARRTV